MSAGYSGKPLFKKLGLKEGFRVKVVNAPAHYFELLWVSWPKKASKIPHGCNGGSHPRFRAFQQTR